MSRSLIINAPILNPPTWLLYFREFTFFVHWDFRDKFDSIIIEVARPELDIYYKFLKQQPIKPLEYIRGFVEEDCRETGLRISNSFELSPTIHAEYINEKNVYSLLRAVSYN